VQNIIRHAFLEDSQTINEFSIAVCGDDRRLIWSIDDNAPPSDSAEWQHWRRNSAGGFGLSIIKAAADHVEFCHFGTGNRVRLWFSR